MCLKRAATPSISASAPKNNSAYLWPAPHPSCHRARWRSGPEVGPVQTETFKNWMISDNHGPSGCRRSCATHVSWLYLVVHYAFGGSQADHFSVIFLATNQRPGHESPRIHCSGCSMVQPLLLMASWNRKNKRKVDEWRVVSVFFFAFKWEFCHFCSDRIWTADISRNQGTPGRLWCRRNGWENRAELHPEIDAGQQLGRPHWSNPKWNIPWPQPGWPAWRGPKKHQDTRPVQSIFGSSAFPATLPRFLKIGTCLMCIPWLDVQSYRTTSLHPPFVAPSRQGLWLRPLNRTRRVVTSQRTHM